MLLKKLVVAEDDDAVAHLVSATLGDAGFLCYRAADGAQALAQCRREMPDLLILDIMMPQMDGYEVAQRLKADVIASQIPILMLTSLGAVDDKVRGLEAGADDYLAKPFDLRELVARVRALIRTSRRERGRNPTTLLPGAVSVEEHVDASLRSKEPGVVLYADLINFEEFVDAAGYHRGDEVVARVGSLLLEVARSHAGEGVFVGHVGGDDFVIVAPPSVAEPIAQDLVRLFEERADVLCADENDPPVAVRMSLSIGLVDLSVCQATTSEELSGHLTTAKRVSKRREGSNYVVWRPDLDHRSR